MNTSLVLTLDKRRAKKDGSYPVIIRISHYERSTSFTTGISVMEKDWDFDKKMIRKTYTGTSSVTRLNNFLSKHKIKAIDIINRLKEEDKLGLSAIPRFVDARNTAGCANRSRPAGKPVASSSATQPRPSPTAR